MARFQAPDYYAGFTCKGNACRNSCCVGWRISVSMQEYFRLLGMPCSVLLRRRLDGAFHIEKNADVERYAAITPRLDGDCPLRAPDGLCALQKEKGEAALPSVCRQYPRAIRTDFAPECACSASCEAVAETLIARAEPLRFVEIETDVCAPTSREGRADSRAEDVCRDLRALCVRVLQDRSLSVADRLARLHGLLARLHACEARRDASGLLEEIARAQMSPVSPERPRFAPAEAFPALYGIARAFLPASASLSALWPEVEARLGKDGAAERYEACRARFAEAYPEWERAFEQLLVNHAFYSRFPFSDRLETLADESLSMAACYGLCASFAC